MRWIAMNHAPNAGSFARAVDQQSSALSLTVLKLSPMHTSPEQQNSIFPVNVQCILCVMQHVVLFPQVPSTRGDVLNFPTSNVTPVAYQRSGIQLSEPKDCVFCLFEIHIKRITQFLVQENARMLSNLIVKSIKGNVKRFCTCDNNGCVIPIL